MFIIFVFSSEAVQVKLISSEKSGRMYGLMTAVMLTRPNMN